MKNLAPETLAAQALGWIDDTTKAIVPPIHVATTFIRDPDNQYRTGYATAAPTMPPFARPRRCSPRSRRRREPALRLRHGGRDRRRSRRCSAGTRGGAQGDVLGAAQLAARGAPGGASGDLRRRRDTAAVRAGRAPGRPSWCGSRRRPTRSGPSPTSPGRQHRAPRRRAAGGGFDRRDAGADAAARARRRHRDAPATKYLNGHSDLMAGALVPPATERLRARRAVLRALGGILGSFEAWLLLRGMRTLHVRVRHRRRRMLAEHFARHRADRGRALSRPAAAPRPRGRGAADARRLRRHAVDPRQRRRGGRRSPPPRGSSCGNAPPRSAASRA